MEPIVLMGLMVVGYGGYVALSDALKGFRCRNSARERVRGGVRQRRLKPAVEKVAWLHV